MTPASRVGVLIVEDSKSFRMLLTELMEADPMIKVLGVVEDGEKAVEFLKECKPDVVIMDIHMPGMDGFEATRTIMESQPVPIIICSASIAPGEVANTFKAIEAGAVAIAAKPVGPGHPDFERDAEYLLTSIKLMSEVKVVRRWPRHRKSSQTTADDKVRSKIEHAFAELIAVGASTGGPQAIQTILSNLDDQVSAPILIVQHIAPGFVSGLAEWLEATTGVPAQVAQHGQQALPRHAYIAPDHKHMGISPKGIIELAKSEPEGGVIPSIGYLFRSAAKSYGAKTVGVLLTGMGQDGAAGLKTLKEAGATTIAQSSETCVVNGMPGRAVELEAASLILSPESIANQLNKLSTRT